MKRPVIMALALAFVLTLGAGSGPAADFAVVPGERIGPLKIGMPYQEALAIMKQYGGVDFVPSPRGAVACNTKVNVGFCIADFVVGTDGESTRNEGVLMIVGTDDPRFRMAYRARVYGSLEDFVKILGSAEFVDEEDPEEGWYYWPSKGFKLVVGEGKVQAIFVFYVAP